MEILWLCFFNLLTLSFLSVEHFILIFFNNNDKGGLHWLTINGKKIARVRHPMCIFICWVKDWYGYHLRFFDFYANGTQKETFPASFLIVAVRNCSWSQNKRTIHLVKLSEKLFLFPGVFTKSIIPKSINESRLRFEIQDLAKWTYDFRLSLWKSS